MVVYLISKTQADKFVKKCLFEFNGATKEVRDIAHVGLPQGSPLSPILYLLFNANLVLSVINKNNGLIAFIDDYTVWVTGLNVDANVEKLQKEIISHMC